MGRILKILGIVAAALPILKGLIEDIEELFGAGEGEAKKNAILSIFEAIWKGMDLGKVKEIKDVPFEMVKIIISPVIDALVAIYNIVGKFKKS